MERVVVFMETTEQVKKKETGLKQPTQMLKH